MILWPSHPSQLQSEQWRVFILPKILYNNLTVTDRLAKNTLYLTLASVGQKVIAFVYFLFLARIMMPDLTGQYFLAVSITVIFTVVADMGITPVVIREVAKAPERAKEFLSHALALKMPLILIAMIAATATGAGLGYDQSLQKLIMFATLVLGLDAIHLLFYGVLRGFQNLKFESIGIFMGMITTGTLGGLVLWLSPSLTLLIGALLMGSVVNLSVSGIKIVKILGWSALRPHWSRREILWIMKTALPFALASLFVKIYSYIDSIFISKFLDTAAVGIYSIAYKFTYAFQFLPLAFVAALYPGMSAVVGKDAAALKRIFNKAIWYMALLSAPIVLGLWAVAPEVVLLAGPEYIESTIVLQTLVFVLLPIFLDFPIGSLLNAADRQSTKTAIMGVTMVINVVLNWFLIPEIGVLGAAYAALASFIFMFLAGLYFVRSIIPTFSLFAFIKPVALMYSSAGLMAVVVVLLKPHIGWIAVIPLGAVVYIAGLIVTRSIDKTDFVQMKALFKRV